VYVATFGVSLMEMRHLRYFVALAEQATFRRAAEQLGIAQPPLSRQIRALEHEIGCRLVVRSSRGIQLTAAGRAFLAQARVTLNEAQRAIDQARVAAPERADRLSIGCEASAEMAVVGRALARLARSHPTMRVALHDLAPDETVRALRAGEMQAAVVALPLAVADEDVAVEVVASVPLCVAVAAGHPIAGPRPVSWRRLSELPFVLYTRAASPVLFDTVVGTFQREGLTMRTRHHATELQAALTLVAARLGVTVMPSGWQPPRALGLTCRPLRSPSVAIAFGVAYRRDARTAAVMRFIDAARATAPSAPLHSPRGRPAAEAAS
jgi:DNA-binding transcriptional LysR family regulator